MEPAKLEDRPRPAPDLGPFQRRVRENVRAFLLTASREELEAELAVSVEMADTLRARFIQELIDEQS